MNTQTAYPNLKQSFGLLGFVIVFTILVSLGAVVLSVIISSIWGQPESRAFLSNSWTLLVLYSLPFVLTLWYGATMKKRREGGYSFSLKSIPPVYYLLLPVATLAIYFIIDPVVDLIPMPDFFKKMMEDLLDRHNVPTFLMLVVAAPVFEEFLCRGIILDGLLKHYSPNKAIIWSAVIFGVMHLNPWQFISAVALGLFMGWIYYQTRSLIGVMLIHAVANGFSFIMGMVVSEDVMTTRDWIGNDLFYAIVFLMCILVLAASVVVLNRKSNGPTHHQDV